MYTIRLCRMQVLLDGRPVGVYEEHWFHRHVSIVGQVRRQPRSLEKKLDCGSSELEGVINQHR
jgi:hypothetical protein